MVVALLGYALFTWWMLRKGKLAVLGWTKGKFFLALSAKVCAALALYAVYTYYYTDRTTCDIYKFFADAEKLIAIAKESPMDYVQLLVGGEVSSEKSQGILDSAVYWEKLNSYGVWNDNRLIIRLDSLLYLLTGGSILGASLLLSLCSFIAMLLLYLRFCKGEYKRIDWLYLALFFSPTCLIWTSGLLKETLVVTFLAITLYLYFSERANIRKLVPVFVFLLLLAKPQIGFFLLLCIVLHWCWKRLKGRKKHFFYPCVLLFVFATIWMNSMVTAPEYYRIEGNTREAMEARRVSLSASYERNVLHQGWNILEKLKFKQLGYRVEARKEHAGSYIEIQQLDGTFCTFLLAIPSGLLNALFRPFLWESRNPLMLLPAIENTILAILFLWVAYQQLRKPRRSFRSEEVLLLTFIVLTATFIGILVPLLGNLIRYKVAFLPFLYVLLLQHQKHRLSSDASARVNCIQTPVIE